MKRFFGTAAWILLFATFVFMFFTGCYDWKLTDADFADNYAAANDDKLKDGLCGWHMMQDEYQLAAPSLLDWAIFDWDYFSVHDSDGEFTGAITYFNADPKGLMSGEKPLTAHLMPSGQNIILYGQFMGEGMYSIKPFGLSNPDGDIPRVFGKEDRSLYASAADGTFGKIEPVRGENGEPDKLILTGNTGEYEYEFTVRQMYAGYNGEPDYSSILERPYEVGNDVGVNAGEHWTVNSMWKTTKIDGWLKRLSDGKTIDIDGHGYRENSFGLWIWALGGWDFSYITDMNTQVAMVFQTYHHGTLDIDFMDVQFMDNGVPKSEQFFAKDGQLGWYHDEWMYNHVSRGYTPRDLTMVGMNDEYVVTAYADIGDNQTPLLYESDGGAMSKLYCINAHFPQVHGTIYRNGTCEVVATFEGQGGGEFSLLRDLLDNESEEREDYFRDTFRYPIPEDCPCLGD